MLNLIRSILFLKKNDSFSFYRETSYYNDHEKNLMLDSQSEVNLMFYCYLKYNFIIISIKKLIIFQLKIKNSVIIPSF